MENFLKKCLNICWVRVSGCSASQQDASRPFGQGWMAQCCLILMLVAWIPIGGHAEDRHPLPSHPPQSFPSDPAELKGIIGVALHLSARRVGDPAKLYVRAVHPEGPAAKAGLAHGDEILAVDGVSVMGKTYEQIVSLIRGEVGQPVTLHVKGGRGDREISVPRISEAELMGQQNT